MEKRFKNGLTLGKFCPPHKGHLHLINTAAKQCETVHVMVCSFDGDPIKGKLRYDWLQSIYIDHPNIKIIHYYNDNPQFPDECDTLDEFYSYWIKGIYDRVDSLDAVFTSESYGDEFADYLRVEHVPVDPKRTKYPVSASNIKEDAFANWDFIPTEVRPYFRKKVAILGPESTGKSTIVKKLAEHYDCSEFVQEYGRVYTAEECPTDELDESDFDLIALGHALSIAETNNSRDRVLFCDTEAITTKIFGEMYLGKDFKSKTIEGIIEAQHFDLWLLMDVDIPWVDDGSRDFPNKREWHFNRLKEELDSRGINYTIIRGNYDKRLDSAQKEVDKILHLSIDEAVRHF